MQLSRLLPLLVLPMALAALEVQAGPVPAYLAANFRAEWRRKPLAEVLDEVQKAIEKPLVVTAAVQALAQRRVILVDDGKSPLRETLERLESTQDLRFTAEPLRLLVESASDAKARRRRPVDLNLSEYMLFYPVRDFPAALMGHVRYISPTEYKPQSAKSDPSPMDIEGVQTWLQRLTEAGEMDARGRMALHVLATPEEEAILRAALGDQLARAVRQSTWRITWGIAPAAGDLPTGILPAADASRVAAKLEQRVVEQMHALARQRVHGGRTRQQSYISDAEIVSSRLDPVADVLRTGRQVDLRPLPGATLTLLEYRLDWVDLTAMPTTLINEGPAAAEPPAKEGGLIPPPPGEQVLVQLPVVWTWNPCGDVVLPHGQGLVLCAEHPQGRAVIVIEEVR